MTPVELRTLLSQTDWADDRDEDGIAAMLAASAVLVAARDASGRLAGFARAIGDTRYRAMIEDVVVDVSLRRHGIGSALVSRLLAELDGVEQIVLATTPALAGFYRRFGFAGWDATLLQRMR